MGTSQSNPGPGGKSPLVPPWADKQDKEPIPTPMSSRFKGFRQSLGSYISGGGERDLKSALGAYSRKATGGGSVASKRMSIAINTGASLYGAFADTSSTFGTDLSLESMAGKTCDQVIEIVSLALTPQGGDSDKIRESLNHALVDALDGVDVFDPENVSDDFIVNLMISYLSEVIFIQIVSDSGQAWNKAETVDQAINAEVQLKELIKVVVDKYMGKKLSEVNHTLTKEEVVQIEKAVICEVWEDWEEFE